MTNTELNNAQQTAVTTDAKRVRVIAGAGSGKTRVLVHRIAWLMSNKQVPMQNIMAVTFTNKAANEMRNRVEEMLGFSARTMWIGTFHGLAHRILRKHHSILNLPENFQIIDADDQLRLIKRLVRQQNLDEETCEPKKVLSFINRHKDEGHRANHVVTNGYPDQMMYAQIYQLYEQHTKRYGLVDFAEILLLAYELWRDHPEILAEYKQRFTHILVDEFQDTNSIQYYWLKMVMSDSDIMIVGDDDQSIYGWRGAKVENIHKFGSDFPDVVTIRLEQNYRSTNNILSAANALISNNTSRLGKELWTQTVAGDPITLYGGFNEIDEARFVVDRIEKWLSSGGNYQDVGILYRSNAQSRVLEQALRQANYPYKIYGGLRFFDRAEIKDVLAYLRLLCNFDDDTAFERIINVPPRGVGERTVAKIREQARNNQQSLFRAGKDHIDSLPAGRVRNGLSHFYASIEEMENKVSFATLPDLIDFVLETSGILNYIKSQPGERTQTKIENLHELVEAGKEYHNNYQQTFEQEYQDSAQTLPNFLSEVALDTSGAGEEKAQNVINMMTLHSAKGLEFPLVFLVGLEDGLFPHHRCTHNEAALEEERRLCYVGITRAMQKLYMCYAQKRSFAGLSGNNRPSRFIEELPKKIIDAVNLNVAARPVAAARPIKKSSMPANLPFSIGQKVRHAKFGEGIVTSGQGSGDSARVQVNFRDGGSKWLVLSYAKLEPA